MSHVRLHFQCDQHLENMKMGENGTSFCSLCQRQLKDFRGQSLREVVQYTENHEGCGIFEAAHVVPDYITLLPISSLRRFILAIGTFFITETAYSGTPSDTLLAKKLKVAFVPETPEKKEETNLPIPVQTVQKKAKQKKSRVHKSKGYDMEYGLFFRKRFPFFSFKQRIFRRTAHGF